MEEYIPKSALVAAIEKLEKLYCYGKSDGMLIAKSVFDSIKNIINTLEVKEVDLEKEIKEEYLNRRCYVGKDNMLVILNKPQFNEVAKHFFELGIQVSNEAQKGENI